MNLHDTLERPENLLNFPPQVRLLAPLRPGLLLADDDRGIRESVGKLLRNAGYQVAFAAHGGHVLERALNDECGLVLLDLNMPGMNGWETLSHLGRLKPQLPVVVITAQPNQQDWARKAGARALMEKPLDLPLLLRTVRDLMDEQLAPAPENAGAARRFLYLPPERSSFPPRLRGWGINE